MEKINALLIIDRIARKFEDSSNFIIAEKLNDIYLKLAKN